MTISVTPLGESFGVEIGNVDLTASLDEATFLEIKGVLIERQVAVISEVPADVEVLVGFGRRFGRFRPHILTQYRHPEADEIAVISNDPESGFGRTTKRPAGSFWHADLTYEEKPCDISFLYSVQVPEEGRRYPVRRHGRRLRCVAQRAQGQDRGSDRDSSLRWPQSRRLDRETLGRTARGAPRSGAPGSSRPFPRQAASPST